MYHYSKLEPITAASDGKIDGESELGPDQLTDQDGSGGLATGITGTPSATGPGTSGTPSGRAAGGQPGDSKKGVGGDPTQDKPTDEDGIVYVATGKTSPTTSATGLEVPAGEAGEQRKRFIFIEPFTAIIDSEFIIIPLL